MIDSIRNINAEARYRPISSNLSFYNFGHLCHRIVSFSSPRVTPAAPGVSAKSGSSSDLFSEEENDVKIASTTERAIDDDDVGVITLDYPGIDSDEDFGEEHR